MLYTLSYIIIASYLSYCKTKITNDDVKCSKLSFTQCIFQDNCFVNHISECINSPYCENLPQQICENVQQCILTSGKQANCKPKKVDCSKLTGQPCVNYPGCQLNTNFQCKNQSSVQIPKCKDLNIGQCTQNLFCQNNSYCTFKDIQCNTLTKAQCANTQGCTLQINKKSSCKNRNSYCQSLSSSQCLNDGKNCIYEQKQSYKCNYQIDCGKLNKDECKNQSNNCYLSEFIDQCQNLPNICLSFSTRSSCNINPSCKWDELSQQCYYLVDCENISILDCLQFKECTFQKSYKCFSYVECDKIKNEDQCNVQKICSSTPSIEVCQPIDFGCEALTDSECKENSQQCNFTEEESTCVPDIQLKSSVNCENLQEHECCNQSLCQYMHSCIQKKLPPCEQMSKKQCQDTSYCQIIEDYECKNKIFTCPIQKQDCLQDNKCLWEEGQQPQCVEKQKFDCSKLKRKPCKKNKRCQLKNINSYCKSNKEKESNNSEDD